MSLIKQLFEIPGCDPSLPIKPAVINISQLTWLYISHNPLEGFLPDDSQTINELICNKQLLYITGGWYQSSDGTISISFAPAGFRCQVSNKKKYSTSDQTFKIKLVEKIITYYEFWTVNRLVRFKH